MKRANDPTVDYRKLVREGYDRCEADYAAARAAESAPELLLLAARLPSGARVLDVGCGAGVPVARTLAQHHRVTGVDVSAEQIRRARANVPGADFIESDVMTLDRPEAAFDAIVASTRSSTCRARSTKNSSAACTAGSLPAATCSRP